MRSRSRHRVKMRLAAHCRFLSCFFSVHLHESCCGPVACTSAELLLPLGRLCEQMLGIDFLCLGTRRLGFGLLFLDVRFPRCLLCRDACKICGTGRRKGHISSNLKLSTAWHNQTITLPRRSVCSLDRLLLSTACGTRRQGCSLVDRVAEPVHHGRESTLKW